MSTLFANVTLAYKGLVRPVLDYSSSVWDPPGVVLQEELESVQKRAARFVTGNYNYETGTVWLTFLESLKKRRKTVDLYCYIKVLKVKPVYQQRTLWHFRLPLLIQMFIKVASSPRLSITRGGGEEVQHIPHTWINSCREAGFSRVRGRVSQPKNWANSCRGVGLGCIP